jgi:hypothetical protein
VKYVPSIEEQEAQLAEAEERRKARRRFDEGFAEHQRRLKDEALERAEEAGIPPGRILRSSGFAVEVDDETNRRWLGEEVESCKATEADIRRHLQEVEGRAEAAESKLSTPSADAGRNEGLLSRRQNGARVRGVRQHRPVPFRSGRSSVVEEVEKLIGAEAEFYEKAHRAKDRDGQVVHGVARDTLLEVRKFFREKGTEQGATCNDLKDLQVGVAIEGDPGLGQNNQPPQGEGES